jgi:hypothetical protein
LGFDNYDIEEVEDALKEFVEEDVVQKASREASRQDSRGNIDTNILKTVNSADPQTFGNSFVIDSSLIASVLDDNQNVEVAAYEEYDENREEFNTNLMDPTSQNAYGYQPWQTVPVSGNWIEAYTPEGHLYYYNDQTGESSWTLPTTAQAPYDAAQQSYDNSLAVQPYDEAAAYSYDPNSYNTYGEYQSNDQNVYSYEQGAPSTTIGPLTVPSEVYKAYIYLFHLLTNTTN